MIYNWIWNWRWQPAHPIAAWPLDSSNGRLILARRWWVCVCTLDRNSIMYKISNSIYSNKQFSIEFIQVICSCGQQHSLYVTTITNNILTRMYVCVCGFVLWPQGYHVTLLAHLNLKHYILWIICVYGFCKWFIQCAILTFACTCIHTHGHTYFIYTDIYIFKGVCVYCNYQLSQSLHNQFNSLKGQHNRCHILHQRTIMHTCVWMYFDILIWLVDIVHINTYVWLQYLIGL